MFDILSIVFASDAQPVLLKPNHGDEDGAHDDVLLERRDADELHDVRQQPDNDNAAENTGNVAAAAAQHDAADNNRRHRFEVVSLSKIEHAQFGHRSKEDTGNRRRQGHSHKIEENYARNMNAGRLGRRA